MNYTTNDSLIENSTATPLKLLVLSLREWGAYFLSKWYIILLFGLLGAGLGYWYATVKKPTYVAFTTFVLDNNDRSNQYAGLASMVGISIREDGGIFQGDNIMELYRSRKMIEQALLSPLGVKGSEQLLIERYIEFNNFKKKWAKNPELNSIKFSHTNKYNTDREQYLHDSIMGGIVKTIGSENLTVSKPDKKLGIVKVEVKSEDELFAKVFDERLVQTVNDFFINTKTKKHIDNVSILQRKSDSVRSVMSGAIARAAQATDLSPNINPTRQSKIIAPVQSAQMNAEINKAILPELIKNLELSKISLSKETPLIQVVDEPILPLDKEGLGKKKALVLGGLLGGIFILFLLMIVKVVKENLQ